MADSAVQSVATGTANGTIKVDGTAVSVYGLKSAAYTESSAYATSTQGTKADSALQSISGNTAQQGKYVNVGTKTDNTQTVGVIVKLLGQTTATQQGLADTHDVSEALANADTTAQGYANTAESNAKSYADSQWEWLDLD